MTNILKSLRGLRTKRKHTMNIKQLDYCDKLTLFDFEKRNKEWFEKFVPPRIPKYFHFDTFSEIVDLLIEEQNQKLCYLFVIYKEERIVGRVNISEIKGDSAGIGYRICQDYFGKQLATESLKELIEYTKENLKLNKLMAQTTKENIASQKVLLRNGFIYTETKKSAAFLNGQNVDLLSFELLL